MSETAIATVVRKCLTGGTPVWQLCDQHQRYATYMRSYGRSRRWQGRRVSGVSMREVLRGTLLRVARFDPPCYLALRRHLWSGAQA